MNPSLGIVGTHFLGSPEARWHGSRGVSFEDRYVNDRHLSIPVFDSEVTDFTVTDTQPIWHKGHEIGTLHSARATLNHDHARNVHLWDVRSESGHYDDLVISDRAALTTEIDGYPFVRARKLAEKGLSTLQIGTEHSTRSERQCRGSLGTVKGLFEAAKLSFDMSIMKTAFEEELVAEKAYRTILGDRPCEIAIGDSQGGMTAPARIAYADQLHGGETRALDIRALCAYEKTSLGRAAFWLARELALTPGLVTEMIVNGETERLSKTISINPELQLGAVLGKIPPLLSGELTKTLEFIDTTIPGQVLRYDSDGISARDADKHWNEFGNINHRSVEGNHLTLGRSRGIESQVERLARMAAMDQERGSLKGISAAEAQEVYRYGSLVQG